MSTTVKKSRSTSSSSSTGSRHINTRSRTRRRRSLPSAYLLFILHGTVLLKHDKDTRKTTFHTHNTPVNLLRLKATPLLCGSYSNEAQFKQQQEQILGITIPPNDDEGYLDQAVRVLKSIYTITDKSTNLNYPYTDINFPLYNREVVNTFDMDATSAAPAFGRENHVRRADEHFDILKTKKKQPIIEKYWALTDDAKKYKYEGIFICQDIVFKFPDIDPSVKPRFQEFISYIQDKFKHNRSPSSGVLDENTWMISYTKGISLLTCPYFVAYFIYFGYELYNTEIDFDLLRPELFNIHSYPYAHDNTITRSRYISLKMVNSKFVYSYFQHCKKIVSIDRSCELIGNAPHELQNALPNQNNSRAFLSEIRRGVKRAKTEALATYLRGGKKYIISKNSP